MSGGRSRGSAPERPHPAHFVTGFLVLALCVALGLIVAWRSGTFERLNRAERTAVTWFHSVGALKTQEQVVFKGYPIGEITEIAYDNRRRLIRVAMSIDAGFRLPERAYAQIAVASMSALSAYIEIVDGPMPQDTRTLVRGGMRVVLREGILELDAVDPVNTGTILTQGSSYIARADAQVDAFFEGSEERLAEWSRSIHDPALRSSVHGGAAEARAMTDDALQMSASARDAMARGEAAARDADRWLEEREDTLAASLNRWENSTREARAWIVPFTRDPALVPE